MNLAAMITKFREGASDLDANLGDGDIQTILQRHYRFAVNSELGDDYARALLLLTTEDGKASYTPNNPGSANGDFTQFLSIAHDLQAYIRDGAQLYPLTVETDPFRFEMVYAGDVARRGRPNTMLAYARGVRFWPTPDGVYSITIPSLEQFTGTIDDAQATTRLLDDRLAMMIVYSSLMEHHADTQDDPSYQFAEREWKRWTKRLKRTARGRASRRHQARSY